MIEKKYPETDWQTFKQLKVTTYEIVRSENNEYP